MVSWSEGGQTERLGWALGEDMPLWRMGNNLFERKVRPCQASPCLGACVASLVLQPALHCCALEGGSWGAPSPGHRGIQVVATQLQLPSKTGNKFQLFLWVGGTNVPLRLRTSLVYFVESALEDVRWLCFFILFCTTGLICGVAVVGMQLREVNLTWWEGFKRDLEVDRSVACTVSTYVW